MRRNLFAFCLALSSTLLPTHANADSPIGGHGVGNGSYVGDGHDVGNGGMSLVCREKTENKKIRWIELLDLVESRTQPGWMPASATQRSTQTSFAQALDRVIDALPGLKDEILHQDHLVRLALTFPTSFSPSPTKDANPEISRADLTWAQERCEGGALSREQLVQYVDGQRDFEDRARVNVGLLRALQTPSLNPSGHGAGALQLHEVLYRVLRLRQADRTSDLTRKIVGLAFAPGADSERSEQIAELYRRSIQN